MLNKGQADSTIIAGLMVLIIVGIVGITSITVYDSIQSSLSGSLTSTTSESAITMDNFTENVYNGYDLASNIPIVLAAGLLLAVIMGFAMLTR